MFGSVTRQKICQPLAPSDSAASSSSVPCSCISGISSRATNGKVTKMVASTMPGHGEDDLDVVRREPRPEPALQAEQQHVDQAGDHRRHRERQVDQRDQQALAAELELGDRPGRGDAEDEVERHRDGRDQQRQPDRRDARPARPARRDRRRCPARSASTNTTISGSSRNTARNAERQRRSATARTRAALGDRGRRDARRRWGAWRWLPTRRRSALRIQRCSRLISSSSSERHDQHQSPRWRWRRHSRTARA